MSSVRACTPSALDSRAGPACWSMIRTRTPRRASWFASISPVGPAPTTRTSVSIGRAPFLRLGRPLEPLEEPLDGRPLRADIVVSRLHKARRVDRVKQEEPEEIRGGVPLPAERADDPAHSGWQQLALPGSEIGQIARRVQQ